MKVGMLTGPMGSQPLEYVIEFAGKNGIDCLEVASGPNAKHIDIYNMPDERAAEIKKLLKENNVEISSLAWYTNMTDPGNRDMIMLDFCKFIDVASKLDVGIVCTLAGMPVAGKDKMQTIQEDCAKVFPPLLDYAASKGIKIALENWYATNIQGLAHFDKMFEVIPNENFGLNFDPSHLMWQGIDYVAAVDRFKDRIFHTHAKDTEVSDEKLAYLGNQAGGWWRYVIPGFGRVKWGEYIAALRRIGYTGVLSIEHEDGTFSPEEGFIKGKNYLRIYV